MTYKKRSRAMYGHSMDRLYQITDINERFVCACENGDYPTVTRILTMIKDFNIDVTDNLGRSALRLAVENEHLEVVQALLDRSDSPKMKEALLLSIYLGHIQIAESILRHSKYKVLNEKKFVNGDTDSFWQTPSSDDAQFSPDVTPLILAAQYNRIEIVQLLLLNGDRITKPHDFYCKCTECFNRFKFDSLRHAQSRLNAYKGLASESYISLASLDSILTSFELGYELRMLSAKEKYFKSEYQQLADQLSSYVCKLLNNVRGRDELEIVLNKTGKESEEKYERLARLDLAIKYEEKPFVAHSNCQQKLVEIWYKGIRKLSKMNQIFVLIMIVCFVFTLPINAIIYMIAPRTKLGKFMNQPCVKFISHTITYLIFIIMIIVSSITFSLEQKNRKLFSRDYDQIYANYTRYFQLENLTHKFPCEDFYIRLNSPNILDMAITVWIVGLFWQECKLIYLNGLRDYLRSWNSIVNSVMNILYMCSFGLKYYTMIVVKLNSNRLLDESFWHKLSLLNETSDLEAQNDAYRTFYWLNDDRYYWASLDPVNMAEGFFAVANIFSFTRICFLLPANQQLGPLQISLGNMISDIIKFVVIFMIVFLAFVFALNNLFWYYQFTTRNNVQTGIDHDDLTEAEQNFGTIGYSLKSMFWAIFGLGDPKVISLAPFQNSLTEFFGLLLYGCYHIASIIVLLNMLVAMMTQSYEKILEESDIEWKFARSKLYMEYIREGATLPVPFNIVPTPKTLYYLGIKCLTLCRLRKSSEKDDIDSSICESQSTHGTKPSSCSTSNETMPTTNKMSKLSRMRRAAQADETMPPVPASLKMSTKSTKTLASAAATAVSATTFSKVNSSKSRKESANDLLTYTKVMQRIVKRFLLHKQRESDEVGDMDLDEIKQDLQMIRFEMLNDIKNSRDQTLRFVSHIHTGISMVGENLFSSASSDERSKFAEYKSIDLYSLCNSACSSGNVSRQHSYADAMSFDITDMSTSCKSFKSMRGSKTTATMPDNDEQIDTVRQVNNKANQRVVDFIIKQNSVTSNNGDLHAISEVDETSQSDCRVDNEQKVLF